MSDRLTKNQVVPSHAQRSGADFVRVMLVILFAVLQPLSSLLANLLPGMGPRPARCRTATRVLTPRDTPSRSGV